MSSKQDIEQLQQLFNQCKQDPANLNLLYTLVGMLTMHVAFLLEEREALLNNNQPPEQSENK